MLRFTGTRQIESLICERSDLFETAGIQLPIEEIRIRKIGRVPKSSVVERYDNEPVGLLIGKRVQDDALQHAEDRCVGANSQRQSRDRRRCKSGAFSQ